MHATRVWTRILLGVVVLAAALCERPDATAYYAGGGSDTEQAKGNDCLIGFEGIDAEDVEVGLKSTFTCEDCDWQCDRDGVPTANGSCVVPIAACMNRSGVAGCVPPNALSKARATYKLFRKKPRALPLPDSLDGSACGAFFDLQVELRRSHGASKPGVANISLRASLEKDKATGTARRRDRDKLRIICTPLPEGQQCRTPRVFRFTTTEPAGECGSVQSGGPDGVVRKSLGCGGLNVGGGNSTVAEGPTPPNTRIDMRVECDGTTCAVSGLTAAETGDAATCSAAGCPFGPYLPIRNAGASTCVRNSFSTAASGTLDGETGSFVGGFPLSSTVYLTANASLPCPLCVGGTPDVPGSGTCQDAAQWTSGSGPSPDAGNACTPVNPAGDTHDCAPPDATRLSPFAVDLVPITTGRAVLIAEDGVFCPGQFTAGAFGCSGMGAPNAICPGGDAPPVPDYIEEVGSPAGPLELDQPAAAVLASVFCIPPAGNFVIDAAANLPGPGSVSLPGTFELRR